MPKKNTKIEANLGNMVQLLNDDEVQIELGEAFASYMLNPIVTWAKFILTDDKKNANGERVPKDEFPNLLKTGINMPVKMARGQISAGHPGTEPLGTITHLKETITEDGTSAIVAIAALWSQERPADVEFIKTRFAEKQPVDVSWEILYEDSTFNSQTESMDLIGTILRAATIVGNPAYEGRTPFLSIAAKKISDATKETNSEENTVNIEELKAEVERLTAQLAEIKTAKETAVAEKETALAEKEAEIARLTELNKTNETKLAELQAFKDGKEAEEAKAAKLAEVKNKFVEAGLEKGDDYWTENAEKLMAMTDDQLSFVIQEVATALASNDGKTSNASKKTKIPALLGNESSGDEPTVDEIAKALRERKAKK